MITHINLWTFIIVQKLRSFAFLYFCFWFGDPWYRKEAWRFESGRASQFRQPFVKEARWSGMTHEFSEFWAFFICFLNLWGLSVRSCWLFPHWREDLQWFSPKFHSIWWETKTISNSEGSFIQERFQFLGIKQSKAKIELPAVLSNLNIHPSQQFWWESIPHARRAVP